jgi:TrpR-related protein YerC/YecD
MNWNTPDNQELIKAVLSLKTNDEAERFLRDLMTEGEIEELAKRLKTAKMLLDKVPYSLIEEETGLSSTTIARVSKYLNGKQKGYQTIINRLHHRPSK